MTNINDLFPSKYLKAADATPAIVVTIGRITHETMKNKDGEEEDKPVIWFTELEKGMVLNRTNAGTLAALFGAECDAWINQRVMLGTEIVTAFGESKPALRFKNEEVKYDRKSLLKRYHKLFEEATAMEVADIDTFVIGEDITDAALVELGKELRAKIDAAKAF